MLALIVESPELASKLILKCKEKGVLLFWLLFENKAKTPHSGDAWLHLPDKKIIMLESKNYTTRVNKDEVEKMESDMKTNHIRFGIFVSWNSIVPSVPPKVTPVTPTRSVPIILIKELTSAEAGNDPVTAGTG